MNARILALLLPVTLSTACALAPPVRDSGPAVSAEGLSLSVVGQRCEQVREPDLEDLVEVVVLVRVHNPTKDRATVRRTEFRLFGDERFALKTRTWGAGEPLDVLPGSDQTFDLRFMARGAVECAKEMRLDPGGAILTRDHPAKLPPVTFLVAQRA